MAKQTKAIEQPKEHGDTDERRALAADIFKTLLGNRHVANSQLNPEHWVGESYRLADAFLQYEDKPE